VRFRNTYDEITSTKEVRSKCGVGPSIVLEIASNVVLVWAGSLTDSGTPIAIITMKQVKYRYKNHLVEFFLSLISMYAGSFCDTVEGVLVPEAHGWAISSSCLLHLTTSDRTARIASIYHNNATHRPKSIEDIQDNAWFVPSEVVRCSRCR
jgi:hypothetical protein